MAVSATAYGITGLPHSSSHAAVAAFGSKLAGGRSEYLNTIDLQRQATNSAKRPTFSLTCRTNESANSWQS